MTEFKPEIMQTEKLLFAVHRGTVSGRPAGIVGHNHALPLACSHHSYEDNPQGAPYAEAGFFALWEATADVEEFFEHIGISSVEAFGERNPNGLYVYEVSYVPPGDDDDDESWDHLAGGELRRPLDKEVAPFAYGKAPWDGVVL